MPPPPPAGLTRPGTDDVTDHAEAASGAGRAGAAAATPRDGSPAPRVFGLRPGYLAVALVVLLAIPLLVALVVLHSPRWFPILDMAQTEIRVRDVGSGRSPLIGLPGRIGQFGRQGSHPGPLSFWTLAPFYRVFGATSWALRVAAVALQVAAMGLGIWIAYRRGGIRLALGIAAVLAVLARAYEAFTLTEAWNPYLPILFWVVLILAVWSVVCDDLLMLPVAVFAGSFCAQTHIPYLGLAGALVVFAIGAAFVRAFRRREEDPAALRRFLRWALIAVAVGAVVWLPPLIDQITSSRGNFTVIRDHFSDPPEEEVGLRRGVELILIHLNPWKLLTDPVVGDRPQTTTSGSMLPGLLFLSVWVASVVAARRLRHRALLRLDLVLALTLVLAVVDASRILGFVWYYLLLWAWGITALMAVAIGWTAAVLVGRRLRDPTRRQALAVGTGVLALLTVVSTVLFSLDAGGSDVPSERLSTTLGEVAGQTNHALDGGTAPGGGRDGRYLVTWDDPVSIGAQGWGLVNELEREGFEVGVPKLHQGGAARDQVLDPHDATAQVTLVVGPNIEDWRVKPGVEQVAFYEPRTPGQQAEYERLRSRVIEDMAEVGLSHLVSEDDSNLLAAAGNPRTPKRTQRMLSRMLDLGLPTAVFVGPPEEAG